MHDSNTNNNNTKRGKVFLHGNSQKEMNNDIDLNSIALKYRYEQMKISEITNKINSQNAKTKRKKIGYHLGPNLDKDLIKGQQILQEIKKKRFIDKDFEYELKSKNIDNRKKEIEEIKIATLFFNQYMDKIGRTHKIGSTFDQFHSFEYDYLDSFLKKVKTVFRHESNTNNKIVGLKEKDSNANKSLKNIIINNKHSLSRNKEMPQLKHMKKFKLYIGENPDCSKRKQTIEKIKKIITDLKSHKSVNIIRFNSEDKESEENNGNELLLNLFSRNRIKVINETSLKRNNNFSNHKSTDCIKPQNNFNTINNDVNKRRKEGVNSIDNKIHRTFSDRNLSENKTKHLSSKSRNSYNNLFPYFHHCKSERVNSTDALPDNGNSINEFRKFQQMKTQNEKILKSFKKKNEDEVKNEMKIAFSKLMFLQNNLFNFISHCGKNFCTNIDNILNQ